MPLENGQYVAPTFVNDSAPALSADEMNAMAGSVQGAVEYDRAQTLTDAEKTQALGNMGGVGVLPQTLTTAEKTQALENINAVSYASQSLTTAQKTQAAGNIGAVSYAGAQSLTAAQKTQSRTNIGAVAASGVNVSVAASAWSGSSAPYTATVTVSGVTSSNLIVVGIRSTASASQYTAFSDGQIICSAQASNSITLKAFGEKPTVSLPVSVLILQ